MILSMPTHPTNASADAFIERWQNVKASELATAQSFVIDLCELLGVDRPHATDEQDYMFERPLKEAHSDGSQSDRRVDCYKRGHFILEAKKLKSGTHTKNYSNTLLGAHAQAQNYARALPAAEGRPPIILVVDVGNVIQLFSEFSRTGGNYIPYPDPRSHQIKLHDLRDETIRQRLRSVWTNPMALDPSRANAAVTRKVADVLATVAKSLEADDHPAHQVGAFLTRCLFSMFAEDVGLLPASGSTGQSKGAFSELLHTHRAHPPTLQRMLQALWADMDRGGFSTALANDVLKFNGKLFKASQAEGYALLLNDSQIDGLLTAAKANWTEVEPAIFGTLLERALHATERHALGAHYTPRAYVDRLVIPTIIDPLRAEWSNAQAAALLLMGEHDSLKAEAEHLSDALEQQQKSLRQGKDKSKKELDTIDKLRANARAKMGEAIETVKAFHHRLCGVRVLDPACGSGNFLYVTLEHLKRLEGEVLNQLDALGHTSDKLGLEGETVTLKQLLGIELNPRAAAVAELVLWIGYLQWQARTVGVGNIAEPVVHDYGNIENRDAVLAYDRTEPQKDAVGNIVTRWDGKTQKPHPVTGLKVPDESAQVVQERYINPRKAKWPKADFIVGNPPFIGNKRMRDALGDGYADALRSAWPEVPESADFVMYWWHKAAETVRTGHAQRFGLITTNSLTMIFNRRVIEAHQNATPPLSLNFAIPDHPWVDSTDGAAVRIAMSVGSAGQDEGHLLQVADETESDNGEVAVTLAVQNGLIHADLKVGANVSAAKKLEANSLLSNRGVIPHGAGFTVTPAEAELLGLGRIPALTQHIRPYRNGKDLTATPRGVLVIDLYGLDIDQVRSRFPEVYQWLLDRVKPERDENNRARVRDLWWLFAEPRSVMRRTLKDVPRYIATGQVAKHRLFQWLSSEILPDDKLIAIASQDALHLGVLSSQVHADWALTAGGRLGVGNDPVYSKSSCFETFPFPSDDTGLTPELSERIRQLAEQVDAHRKTQQASHPDLTLTGMYNVLDKLRSGEAFNGKDKTIHEQGLVSVLRTLHDELDAAVLAAYGWGDIGPTPWGQGEASARAVWTEALLQRLVDLNTRRAAEEASGTVRWLRPEFQNPAKPAAIATVDQTAMDLGLDDEDAATPNARKAAPTTQQAWPSTLPEQIKAVAEVLSATPTALDLDAIAAHFKGKGRWRERLPMILDTLVAIGRVRKLNDEDRWQ
ncbi:MAG: hypothetical protein RJB34_65 [Pseudomonadota bacterium]|jgi:hypothetical protein